jgi:hypothetical protein
MRRRTALDAFEFGDRPVDAVSNVKYHSRPADENLPPRIQTPVEWLTHQYAERLAQLRLQGVARHSMTVSEPFSSGFGPQSGKYCSRRDGGSSCQ